MRRREKSSMTRPFSFRKIQVSIVSQLHFLHCFIEIFLEIYPVKLCHSFAWNKWNPFLQKFFIFARKKMAQIKCRVFFFICDIIVLFQMWNRDFGSFSPLSSPYYPFPSIRPSCKTFSPKRFLKLGRFHCEFSYSRSLRKKTQSGDWGSF